MKDLNDFTSIHVRNNKHANNIDALCSWLGIFRREGESDEDMMVRYEKMRFDLGRW